MKMSQSILGRAKITMGAIAIGVIALTSVTSVYAANTIDTTLLATCDLKAEGWSGARSIAKMAAGEKIVFYPQKFGSDTEYNYMKRNKTSQYGYVDHNYVDY